MAEKKKIPKKVKLIKLTFYRNDDWFKYLKQEFDVVDFKSEWQIPIGIIIEGKRQYFGFSELEVTEWQETE